MKKDIFFIPLGGGQSVGASCYFLQFDGINIILDAGTGKKEGKEYGPNFSSLLTSPFIQSLNQINNIFISHAHMDHIGCLIELMSQSKNSNIFMTEITKVLSEYQLYDKIYLSGKKFNEGDRLAVQNYFDQIITVSYNKPINFGRYKVTFYPAGHIPGASMMLFEYGNRKILYTGDYSIDSTLMTQGCILPEDINVDTVIMCALHAKHPNYEKADNELISQANKAVYLASFYKKSVLCRVSQLSKGIEFLEALNSLKGRSIPVYIDDSVLGVVEKMEQLNMPILKINNKIYTGEKITQPHILINANKKCALTNYYSAEMNVDFSLHEDFNDMKKFIKKLNPKQAILVHCAKEKSVFDRTIEQEILFDSECRTQFIFAEENEIYKL